MGACGYYPGSWSVVQYGLLLCGEMISMSDLDVWCGVVCVFVVPETAPLE